MVVAVRYDGDEHESVPRLPQISDIGQFLDG
jgi:hypothetical protein